MYSNRETVIIVDDDFTSLAVGKNALSAKYDVFTAASDEKLFSLLEKLLPDLILLEVRLPGLDGFEIVEKLNTSDRTRNIPVIFMISSEPLEEKGGLCLGAVDCIEKPFSRELLLEFVDLRLQYEDRKKELLSHKTTSTSLLNKKTKIVSTLLSDGNNEFAPTIETVSSEIGSHGGRESGYIVRMGRYLEILFDALLAHEAYGAVVRTWDKELFLLSAQLHDVGNIAISDQTLSKPDALTEEEFFEIQAHVEFGLKIIDELKESLDDKDMLHHAELLVGSHHECWDGTGYPRGLTGKQIPLQGRIMAIVDVYDALTTNRPHRNSLSHEDAVKVIQMGSDTQFDPELVGVFVSCSDKFDKV